MYEDLLDDIGLLNAADDLHCLTTGWAGFNFNTEDALGALCSGHRATTSRRCRLVRIRRRNVLTSAPPVGGRHLPAEFAVRSKDPDKTAEVDSWLGCQCQQNTLLVAKI